MTGPVNMFVGADPLLGVQSSFDEQIRALDTYQQKLKALKEMQERVQAQPQQAQAQPQKLIWDEIDDEVAPMTNEQKDRLFMNPEYNEYYTELQGMVQAEILNLVKGRIESTERGRELLSSQLKLVKKLKTKIVDETNREMEMFRKFKEYSKQNPGITYEEFIKANMG